MARLIFRNGPFAGKALTLPDGKPLTIGRNRDLDLPLPDLRLSRKHCQVEASMLGVVLRDLASTNGTFVNGQRVETEVQLNHLDIILIGDTEIEFQMPEAIDQGQTRIGPAAKARTPVVPVQVSPALEPATAAASTSSSAAPPSQIPFEGLPAGPAPVSASGTAPLQPAQIPIEGLVSGPANAPVAVPVSPPQAMAAPEMDPLAVAIAELDSPLPPEPIVDLPPRPQVAFCDQCNGSIPIVDVDLCIAKEIDNKLYCRECMAKGVPGGKAGAWPPPDHWGKSASEKDIDDILKGLDQVEEIALEDNAARRAAAAKAHPEGHTSRQQPVSGPPKTESAFDRLLNEEPAPPPKPKPKVPPPKLDDLLGDEFEEIG